MEPSGEIAQPPRKKAGLFERASIKFRAEWVEILSAAILALATIATAWCAYQSARWSGLMTISFAKSNTARTQSTKTQTAGGQLIQVDVGIFMEYVNAVVDEQQELADFIKERWFSEELNAATDAWLALDPIDNPDSPTSPFVMPEYKSRGLELSQSYDTLADSYRKDALNDNQRSDNYVLLAVFFASVLFFAGMCTKFKQRWLQITLLTFAIIILCVGAGILLTFPVH
ncbi:MAG: hypothetical protein C4536_02200 [Actinobacteria bacterium]|jgi:hypothetical protein|nr:MAG: hypothetical protein C4536_02200 [Actinomycetota bacterium]